ncbi:ketopantoate reductase family protein [Erwinia endophytica]|uniref:ketopantoate reductase family protein n=1 Tax=Erwinia endophytica TaxID=1563158 RepID=UPI00195E127F|nr:2-dehydropantoate 2-reductase [Erwinia endophytica]
MGQRIPKICVYGAGAIGCHLAGHLAQSKQCEVAIIDREKVVTVIKQRGIRVITPNNDVTVQVHATTRPEELGIQDYVIIATKIQQASTLLNALSHLIGPDTTILPPSTGIPYFFFHQLQGPFKDRHLPEIDPDDQQWRLMPPAQVLPVVFWYGAHSTEPGVTHQDGVQGHYPLGELNGQTSERARLLSHLLEQGGLRAPITDNIRGEIWIKFANSLCWNPIGILTLADMNGIAAAPEVVTIIENMLSEIDAIADSFGLKMPQSIAERIDFTLSTGQHKVSMLQDLERHRPLELDPFENSLAAVKNISGKPTPTIDIVLALAKLRNTCYNAENSKVAG